MGYLPRFNSLRLLKIFVLIVFRLWVFPSRDNRGFFKILKLLIAGLVSKWLARKCVTSLRVMLKEMTLTLTVQNLHAQRLLVTQLQTMELLLGLDYIAKALVVMPRARYKHLF